MDLLGFLTQTRIQKVVQPQKLVRRLKAAGVEHLEKASANIENIHVTMDEEGNLAYLCDVHALNHVKTIEKGDGTPIPPDSVVEIKGFRFPKEGFYNLKDAVIFTNGKVTVTPGKGTKVILVRE